MVEDKIDVQEGCLIAELCTDLDSAVSRMRNSIVENQEISSEESIHIQYSQIMRQNSQNLLIYSSEDQIMLISSKNHKDLTAQNGLEQQDIISASEYGTVLLQAGENGLKKLI
jgi:hypothetical protein